MTDEIALFIDFENIRYSLINVQRREPDPQELIGVARRFGTVMVARAYADWTRQPEFFKGSLTAAMIDRVDCPAKVRERFRQAPYGQPAPYDRGYDRLPPRDQQMEPPLGGEDYGEEERELAEAEGHEEAPLTGAAEEHEEAPVEQETPEDAAPGEEEAAEEDHRGRFESAPYASYSNAPYGNGGYNNAGYNNAGYGNPGYGNPGYGGPNQGYGNAGYGNSGYYSQPQQVITQSTVDLNMLMDIIETVFDRPSITTFVLMTGDRDFTRISARLKLRLNKRVIVVGVPGTVSRDLISAAEQFIPLGFGPAPMPGQGNTSFYRGPQQSYPAAQGPVEPEEPGFIQFLDYIDRHWSWRTVGGVANFIGDPFNPKNRFRGRLTRDSARDLLRVCIDDGILILGTDATGSENLRLNRDHPTVAQVLNEQTIR